jgi:hypothetical protein
VIAVKSIFLWFVCLDTILSLLLLDLNAVGRG